MPVSYILCHLLASLTCFSVFRYGLKRPHLQNLFAILVVTIVLAGFFVQRRTDWAWTLMGYGGPGLVFLTNVSLEGVAVLAALLWRNASTKSEKRRALVLSLTLLLVALWSYAWYFEPLPHNIAGRVDSTGFFKQSTEDSCSAAAAAMLLHQYGITATEAEMAQLCLTRAGKGTSPLGLFRGLALKAASHGLAPQRMYFGQPEQLGSLKQPILINIGLKADAPSSVVAKMQGYGWEVGSWHTVLVTRADGMGKWIDVSDPSYGKERWPTEGLQYLWDGSALILTKSR